MKRFTQTIFLHMNRFLTKHDKLTELSEFAKFLRILEELYNYADYVYQVNVTILLYKNFASYSSFLGHRRHTVRFLKVRK